MLAGPPLKTNGFPAAKVAALNSWISGLGTYILESALLLEAKSPEQNLSTAT